MGSACHQMGVYEVLPRLQALLSEHGMQELVVLKGSFCLENCSQGISMKFGECNFSNIHPNNVEEKFLTEILPTLQKAT